MAILYNCFSYFIPKAQEMFVVGVTKLTVVSSNNIYFKKKLLLEIIGISLAVCTGHILTSFFAFVSLQGEKNCRICLLWHGYLFTVSGESQTD